MVWATGSNGLTLLRVVRHLSITPVQNCECPGRNNAADHRAFTSPDAITVENLTSSQGFRAATGLFRFRPDGRIERRMIVHRIENGGLKIIQEEGEGF